MATVWYPHFCKINFKELPNQFVIKCTHDSGGLVIVKDKSKINIKAIRNIGYVLEVNDEKAKK